MRHTYCFVTVIVGLYVLILPGCARLSVQVDILNSAFWISPQYIDSVTLTKIVDTEQAVLDGRFANKREAFKAAVKQAMVEVSKEQPPPTRRIEPNIIVGLADGFNKNLVDPGFEEARGDFKAAFDEAITAGKATSAAKTRYGRGTEKLVTIGGEVSRTIRKDITMPDGWPSPALDKLQRKAEAIVGGLIGGAGVLDDPRAAAIVYAPEDYWTGQSYNKTLCSGWLGNSDCAVRMESLGDFTLKGVRLDATKITQATFSVAREAIQIVAAVYGIPVPKSEPTKVAPGDKGSESQAPGEITSPVKRQRDAETAILQLRLARIAMFEMIVAQSQAIEDDKTREQAIQSIKNVLNANIKLLDPSPAQ